MSVDTAPLPTGNAIISRSVENTPQLRFTQRRNAALRPSWLATGALVVVLVAPVGTASALQGLRFETQASPAQEVPPALSDGSAKGRFSFSKDLSQLDVRVDVRNLTGDVLAAHLHCNIAGANGPVIVDLLAGPSGRIVDDLFVNEDVTDAGCTEQCGFEINNIASLRQAAEDGCIYFNAHTDEFPNGEVRGQLLPR